MEIFGNDLTPHEVRRRTGDLAAVGGVRQFILDNGVERGVRVVQLRSTSGLELEVLVDRALDLGVARFRGEPFGWRSGNGFRHPGLHENTDENGLSWLRSIDGLLVTGGLDHILFGLEVDASTYAYPPRKTVTHGIHGRLTGIPARLLEAGEVWDGDRCVLRVRGEVIQATVFGERLRLTRTIEMDLDGSEIRLHDVVDNIGFDRTPHMFLYHLNVGWPFLDEGAELVAPISSTLWSSDSAASQGASYRHQGAPQPGFVEQVFEHQLVSDAENLHRIALITKDGERGIEVSWDAASMPCFFEWQNLRDGGYGIGLEPSTHHVGGEGEARADGSMTWLEHGESRTYRTTIAILTGAEQTDASRRSIRSIAGQPE